MRLQVALMRKFAVLILTHGRADNVITVQTLRENGYTGDIYIIIDDEDKQADRYKELYGDHVVVFNKQKYFERSMIMNPEKPRNIVLYARNAAFDIAKQLGLKYFLELDDDYTVFEMRDERNGKLVHVRPKKWLDKVFSAFCDWLDSDHRIKTVALAQGGDYIGGANSSVWKKQCARKVMNSFFCRTDREFQFMGAINEDVNLYVSEGNRGDLFFTNARVSLEQERTQQQAGGLTDTYLQYGTYVKSFYTVMLCPSCVKIGKTGVSDMRIHHHIDWRRAVPCILSDKHKKREDDI